MQTNDISTTSRADNTATSSQNSNSSSNNDFKTFLTLLTAQMRNQDPLKPMDSTEFVAQLASFSSVEQQVQTNSKLDELLDFFAGSSTGSLTEWLGKEVRHEGSASFDGQLTEIEISIHPSANNARLVVRDESAAIVYTQQIDPNSDTTTWNGETQGTESAPTGRYTFDVESYMDDDLLETNPGAVFDLVTEVRMDQGNIVLIFEDGTALLANDANAIRMHQS